MCLTRCLFFRKIDRNFTSCLVDCYIRFRHFNKSIGIDSPNITCNIGIENIFVIVAGGDVVFQKEIPGAQGQPHTTINGAGHFLQEQKGEEWAETIVKFVRANPK